MRNVNPSLFLLPAVVLAVGFATGLLRDPAHLRALLVLAVVIDVPAGLLTIASVQWSRWRGTPRAQIDIKKRFVNSLGAVAVVLALFAMLSFRAGGRPFVLAPPTGVEPAPSPGR